jgi:hypothetical protein
MTATDMHSDAQMGRVLKVKGILCFLGRWKHDGTLGK